MNKPATDVFAIPQQSDSLTRADALEREITDLCAQINAASYRLLQLIAELDDAAPWGAWGLQSCAHWLNWRCGIGLNAAREKVRIAHALKSLPAISSAFESGRLSFSKVRALTRIADLTNEAKLLELAHHATAAQVEKLVRAYRRVDRLAEREQAMVNHAARELNYYHDDDGCLVIRARLPAEEGAIVLQALNAAMDAPHDEKNEAAADDVTAVTSENGNRFAQRRADALTTMAETTLRHGPVSQPSAERYQVVVHVTAETLAEGDAGRSELECGQRLAPDTARRIACGGSLLRITEDAAGNPLDIGRKTRAVPPAMQRALRSRDGGCCFPGCIQDRFVDAHHVRHWANGGETSLDNLALLCRRHHRLVHEGGFGVERTADGALRFTRPAGRVIAEHPRLPANGDIDGLRGSISREGGQPIDAADWIIPEGTLDLDLAISGLMRFEERGRGWPRLSEY
ncbi:MAG: DUF222 domain-containing protein [Gammaproteobacteria bacterium]|nr:DUF222 domain-containing protein [Gammaproteobacteria bacterium]